jgi:L-2-hydroxyglutarate oxidase LhgO
MSESIDCVVIGAGVVGLGVARALTLSGREVVVLEKNAHIGEETSSRNSEVIHGGIYYPTNSLKARLCVTGKTQLYEYCEARNIEHRRCGKVIVAIDDAQISRLTALQRQGNENGVHDLERLDTAALRRIEPHVRGTAALRSPSTGIVDVHGLMLAFQADIEAAGGTIAVSAECVAGTVEADRIRLTVASGGAESSVSAHTIVNAGGLHASRVARALLGAAADVPETRYAKGNYFTYQGPSPFRHLVYPLPVAGGLGIHATLDLSGRVRFGPDVEWIDTIDYTVDPARAAGFHAAIRQYWPEVRAESLQPSYAGVRPKLHAANEAAADFLIQETPLRGSARMVHLFGIESPGLTAALAIGDYVVNLLRL